MVHHYGGKVFALIASAVSSAGVAVTLVDEHVDLIKLIAWVVGGVVTMTIGIMIGLDARIDAKVNASHRAVMKEFRHLRELLEEKGVIHNHKDGPPTEE